VRTPAANYTPWPYDARKDAKTGIRAIKITDGLCPPLVANYGQFVSTYNRGMLLKDAETFANGAETFTFGAACGKKCAALVAT